MGSDARITTVLLLFAALVVAISFMPDEPTATPRDQLGAVPIASTRLAGSARDPEPAGRDVPADRACGARGRRLDAARLFKAIGVSPGAPSAQAERPRSPAPACRPAAAPSGSR
jgi:hypothetical protein